MSAGDLHDYYAKVIEAIRAPPPLKDVFPASVSFPSAAPAATEKHEDFGAYVEEYGRRVKDSVTCKNLTYRERRSNADYVRYRLKIAESPKEEQNTYITHVLRSSFAEFDAYQRELVKISRSSSSRHDKRKNPERSHERSGKRSSSEEAPPRETKRIWFS